MHELQQGLDGLRRQLQGEEEAVAKLREETEELREQAVETREVHRLLRGPTKNVDVSGVVLNQRSTMASSATQVTDDSLQDIKRDLLQPLATLETRSSSGLSVLELLGNVRDQLCNQLLT